MYRNNQLREVFGLFALAVLFIYAPTIGCGGNGGTATITSPFVGRYSGELLLDTATKGGPDEFVDLQEVTVHSDGRIEGNTGDGTLTGSIKLNGAVTAECQLNGNHYYVSGTIAWQTWQEARGGPDRWLEGSVNVRDEKGEFPDSVLLLWPE